MMGALEEWTESWDSVGQWYLTWAGIWKASVKKGC